MSDWIDINLRWYARYDSSTAPNMPDLKKEEEAHFGISLDDLAEKLGYYNLKEIRGSWLKSHRETAKEKGWAEYTDEWYESLDIVHAEFIREYPAIKEFEDKIEEYDAWDKSHPLFIAATAARDKHREDFKQTYFCGRGLALPGTLIELDDNSRFLIGNINTAGGTCDDCPGFEEEEIVKRYKIVYVMEN